MLRGFFTSKGRASQWLLAFVLPGLILCLGLALRLYALDSKSLWFDELGTLSYVAWDTTWLDTLRDPLTFPSIPIPPLFFLITRAFTLLGYSEFLLRWPSVLFSTLTLALTYVLGRLWFDRWVAMLGAFFLAISPLHIRYAQEARSYATLVFFSILSLYLFWRAIQSGRRRWWVAFVVVAVLNLYTHLFGLLPLGVIGLFGMGVRPRGGGQGRFQFQRWRFGVAMGVIVLAFLPMLPHLLTGLSSDRGLVESPDIVVGGLQWGWEGLVSFVRLFGAGTNLGAVAYAALFVLGAVALARTRRDLLVLVVLWVILPVVLILLVPFSHRVLIRYFLFALPVYLLVGAYGLIAAIRWLSYQLERLRPGLGARPAAVALSTVLIASLFVGSSVPAFAAYQQEIKQNWRDATRLILAYAQPGDQIYVADERQQTGLVFYAKLLASESTRIDQFSVHVLPQDPGQAFSLRREERGWLVVPFQVLYVPGGELDTALKGHRFWPPLVLSSAGVPQDRESIAPFSFQNLALVRFEPAASASETCQPGDRQQFETWLDTDQRLGLSAVDANLSLGLYAYYCGDMVEAFQRLSSSALPIRQEALLSWMLGDVSQGLGRWNDAIDYYRRAIALNPSYVWLEVKIGNSYREMGEFGKAEASYLRALETDDESDWTHSELADLYDEMGQPDLALQEYQRANELAPQNARYLVRMGQIYDELELPQGAKNSYQQAIDLEPDNGWYHALLAGIQITLEEPEKAVHEYQQALALQPGYAQNPWFYLQLAKAYRLADRLDEALSAYEQVLALDGDNGEARKWVKELQP